MSDITGDSITIHAAEKIEDAIEHVGFTSSQQQVGKAIKLALDSTETGFNARGAKKADDSTTKVEFLGVVKAVTSEAQGTFAKTKMLGNPVTGANPTEAPYYLGNVTVLAGQGLTVERNCITYVLAEKDAGIKFGDPIKCADDGKFTKADPSTDQDSIVGRSYSNQADNRYDVIRVSIQAY
jgi:hypothetical protein